MSTNKTYSGNFYIADSFIISYDVPKQSVGDLLDLETKEHSNYRIYLKDTNQIVQIDEINIPAIVVEVTTDHVILNCLIDAQNKVFQRRKFDIAPFKGKFELLEGDGLIITIKTNPGERSIHYEKNDSVKIIMEEPKDRFSRFAGTALFPDK